jgi:hypothetical protein
MSVHQEYGSAGCPGVDKHGRGSPPCGGGHSVGVLRKTPLKTQRLVPYMVQGNGYRGDPYTHRCDHRSTSCS